MSLLPVLPYVTVATHLSASFLFSLSLSFSGFSFFSNHLPSVITGLAVAALPLSFCSGLEVFCRPQTKTILFLKLPRFGFDWQEIVSEFKRNKFCVSIASRKMYYIFQTLYPVLYNISDNYSHSVFSF